MNRRIPVILMVLLLLSSTGYAQTWSEWFRQKKTQRKYLLQQIAKLQVYLGYVKKGYAIVGDGLNIIGDIKNGDWLQHADYFDRLAKVNPIVKKYAKIPAIISRQVQMLELYKKFYTQFRQSSVFSEKEIDYLLSVFTSLLNEVATEIDDLIQLVTDHQLDMSDSERLKRMDELYAGLENKYEFLFSFCRQTQTQQLQRTKEIHDLKTLQQLYQP